MRRQKDAPLPVCIPDLARHGRPREICGAAARMNSALVDQLISATLYDRDILPRRRPFSIKNRRQRFSFGRVHPETCHLARPTAEPARFQTECLVETLAAHATLAISLRFLQPLARHPGVLPVPGAHHDPAKPDSGRRVGEGWQGPWRETIERRIEPPPFKLQPMRPHHSTLPFEFPSARIRALDGCGERQNEGRPAGLWQEAGLCGKLDVTVHPLGPQLHRITVRVGNQTPLDPAAAADADTVLLRTFAATHTVLEVQGGQFVSLIKPPARFEDAAATCQNVGTWPVLVGDPAHDQRQTMLSAPVILCDYPQVATDSPAASLAAPEIDETLTAAEKPEMRAMDEHARPLRERTEAGSEDSLIKLHGLIRALPEPASRGGGRR